MMMWILSRSGIGSQSDVFNLCRVVYYSNLWIFVSKFTSASAGKLYKIYRKAKKNISGGVLSDSEHQVEC